MTIEMQIPSDGVAAHFQRYGYTTLGAVLDDRELETVRSIILGDPDVTADDGIADEHRQYSYHRDERYRQMFQGSTDLRLHHEELMPIVKKTADTVRTLIGDDIRILWDSVFMKPPVTTGTRPTVWHQDWVPVPLDRRGMLTVWIALFDVPVEKGAMRFVPRSHRLGPLGRVDYLADYELHDLLSPLDLQMVDPPVTVTLKAGEASVHDGLLVHGAWPNLSDSNRWAWTLTFIPGNTQYTGAPIPVAGLNELGLQPHQTFDHPRFAV